MKIVDAVTMAEILRFGMVAELDVTEMGRKKQNQIIGLGMRWMFVHFFHSVEIPSLQTQVYFRCENENYSATSVDQ